MVLKNYIFYMLIWIGKKKNIFSCRVIMNINKTFNIIFFNAL